MYPQGLLLFNHGGSQGVNEMDIDLSESVSHCWLTEPISSLRYQVGADHELGFIIFIIFHD